MDTQETGTTEEQTSTATTDETATSDTSATTAEDADYKRAVDKKAYLADLDRKIKEKEALVKAKKGEPEDTDDVITWMTVNSDGLKLVSKEFQEELAFYKSHRVPVTNDIRDRALRDARARKGVRTTVDADRSAETSTPVSGEMRKTQSNDVPDDVKRFSKTMTPEKYAKYKAEFEARKKKG